MSIYSKTKKDRKMRQKQVDDLHHSLQFNQKIFSKRSSVRSHGPLNRVVNAISPTFYPSSRVFHAHSSRLSRKRAAILSTCLACCGLLRNISDWCSQQEKGEIQLLDNFDIMLLYTDSFTVGARSLSPILSYCPIGIKRPKLLHPKLTASTRPQSPLL